MKKNWQAFCLEFKQAKLLLENITRATGEQIKKLALRIEQMTRKAYVNIAQICEMHK